MFLGLLRLEYCVVFFLLGFFPLYAKSPIREYDVNDFVIQRSSVAFDPSGNLIPINRAVPVVVTAVSGFQKLRDIAGFAPIGVDPVRQRVICLDNWGIGATKIAYTTTGEVVTVLKQRTEPPFSDFLAEASAAVGAGSIMFQGAAVLDNGYILLSVAHNVGYHPSGFEASRLYLSTDGGFTWTHVLNMRYGYAASFSFGSAEGPHIVLGEYGSKISGLNGPRNIYVSHDYGQSWGSGVAPNYFPIFQLQPGNMHIHTCAFDPLSNYTKIYVSCGDDDWTAEQFLAIEEFGGLWFQTKKLPVGQPTAVQRCGDKLLWGADDSPGHILLHDTASETFTKVLELDSFRVQGESGYNGLTFLDRSIYNSNCFDIDLINGVYYATAHLSQTSLQDQQGLYVSADGIHWAALFRKSSQNAGTHFIAGVLNGLLFVTKHGDMVNFGEVYSEPKVQLITAARSYPSLKNWCTADNSSFEGINISSGYLANRCVTACSRTTSVGKFGLSSLQLTIKSDGMNNFGFFYFPKTNEFQMSPEIGDYVTVSWWMKSDGFFPDHWTFSSTMITDAPGSCLIASSQSSKDMLSGWCQFSCVAKITGDFKNHYLRPRLTFSGINANDIADRHVYIDGVSYLISGSKSYEFVDYIESEQAQEYAQVSLLGAGTFWSVTLDWFPRFCAGQVRSGTVDIARIVDVDGGKIVIYWDPVDLLFKVSNGHEILTSNGIIYTPRYYDDVKIGIIGTPNGTVVRVFDPLNGLITIGDNTRCVLPLQPSSLTLGRIDGDGIGAFGNVRVFNSALSEEETLQVFNRLANYLQKYTGAYPSPTPDCPNPPSMDRTADCKIDMSDFIYFASEWLTCGLAVQADCW